MAEFKIEDEDLYEILEISPESTMSDIKKAYRKKALQCHPDKNPNNPNAAKLFHKLTRILEVLTDPSAKAAYDRVLKGKKEAAIRHNQLDSKRRKLKEVLEAREQAAKNQGKTKIQAEQLKEEIERLRQEGVKIVREEIEYLQKQVKEQLKTMHEYNNCRIKINWAVEKGDLTNGGYNEEILCRLLSQYGNITALIISPKKSGSALVEFNTPRAAEMAFDLEHGLPNNPLHLTCLRDLSKSKSNKGNISNTIKPSDYESIVITKLKQAEERKKLIVQMMAEDNEG